MYKIPETDSYVVTVTLVLLICSPVVFLNDQICNNNTTNIDVNTTFLNDTLEKKDHPQTSYGVYNETADALFIQAIET